MRVHSALLLIAVSVGAVKESSGQDPTISGRWANVDSSLTLVLELEQSGSSVAGSGKLEGYQAFQSFDGGWSGQTTAGSFGLSFTVAEEGGALSGRGAWKTVTPSTIGVTSINSITGSYDSLSISANLHSATLTRRYVGDITFPSNVVTIEGSIDGVSVDLSRYEPVYGVLPLTVSGQFSEPVFDLTLNVQRLGEIKYTGIMSNAGDILAGELNGSYLGTRNLFVSSTSDGTGTAIEHANRVLDGIKLLQNFPNPFSLETTFRYSLHKQSVVSLTVFDVLGNRVAAVERNSVTSPGEHSVSWDGKGFAGSNLANGIYLYRISTYDSQVNGTVILAK